MDKYELISILWVECPDGTNVVVEAPYATASEGDMVLIGNDVKTAFGIVKAKVTEYNGSPVLAMLRETTKYYKAKGVYSPKWTEKGEEDESSGS